MKKNKKILALVLAIVFTAVFLAACGGNKPPASPSGAPSASQSGAPSAPAESSGSAEKKSFTMGLMANDGSFDRTAGSGSVFNSYSVWDNPFIIDPVTHEVKGQMVDKYEWIDNLTLKMTLKDNIYSDSGHKITGEDVLYSMSRFLGAGRLSSYYAAYDFEKSFVDPNNPITFTLIYKYEYGPGLSYLTDCPVSPKAWAETASDEDWFMEPDVTGPYRVLERNVDLQTVFELRDNYYGDTTGLPDRLTVRFYSERSTMYVDYANGVLDAVFDITSSDISRLASGEVPGSVYGAAPTHDVLMVILPDTLEIWDDIRVRQAFAHAIDMSGVTLAAFGSLALPASSTLPSTVNYYINAGFPYKYDPELSKKLLAEAGYANGLDLHLVSTNDDKTVATAEAIQGYLSQVGINLSIESYAVPTAIPMMNDGLTDFVLKNAMEGSPQLDPDKIWDTLGERSTFHAVKTFNPEFNAYLYGGLDNIDKQIRADNYAKAQRWMFDSYRYLPVCEIAIGFAFRENVATFNFISPFSPNIRGIVMK